MDATQIDELERKPQTVRRTYYACDCNQGQRPDGREPCTSRHANLAGVAEKVCSECRDSAETHYVMGKVTDDGWIVFYNARRGHDDNDPAARASGEICDGAPKEVQP